MTKRKTIPRASIQVGILDDEDFIALTNEPNGYECFGVFVAIVLAVRDSGINPLPWAMAQRRTGKNQNEIKEVIKTVSKVAEANGNDSWLLENNCGVIVRSFSDWNSAETRGGYRKGAGRKPKQYQQDKSKNNQSGIKTESKTESKTGLSVSVTVSDTVTKDNFNNTKNYDHGLGVVSQHGRQVAELFAKIAHVTGKEPNAKSKLYQQFDALVCSQDHDATDWQAVANKVKNASDWFKAQNFGLDWIAKPINTEKILRGDYDGEISQSAHVVCKTCNGQMRIKDKDGEFDYCPDCNGPEVRRARGEPIYA